MLKKIILLSIIILPFCHVIFAQNSSDELTINELEYFETKGLNILFFNNWYNSNFSDSKISSVEIIHHGVRTATNGDVRLSPTPEQWDPIPQFKNKEVNVEENSMKAYQSYSDFNFEYYIKGEAKDGGIYISVNLDEPLPKELEGKAGFNIEFLPSAYFERAYLMDDKSGVFPLYPSSSMEITKSGKVEPLPLASGKQLVLAPEDPERRVLIKTLNGELSLYDGRNKAQNGWFVIRTMIPANKTGKVVEWFIAANTISNWIREPVITHSQVGYHPAQKKVAVIEFDTNDNPQSYARLLKVKSDGAIVEVLRAELNNWGKYLRYNYFTFDFSSVTDEGLYIIEYDSIRTKSFSIAKNVYEKAWHPTLDVFFPVQMDHMFVNEAYRVWHGAAHLDDALQAPLNHEHFDLYRQGPTTDTKYEPGEHIPGLNVGGWFDAGDFDIRTQTHYYTVLNLVHIWEDFGLMRDQTLVDQDNRYVDIHHPDGKPDLLQQIEHGTIQLLAQFNAVGHAINGIIVPDISQYTHLGDALTMTDNLIFNSTFKENETDGFQSGKFDDRWAFTNKSTPLNYGSISALAAASRALKDYNKKLADECLATAIKVWDDEHTHEPVIFKHGNTTGGSLLGEELKAAVELLITTNDKKYAERIKELFPEDEKAFLFNSSMFTRAIPFMNEEYKIKIKDMVSSYAENFDNMVSENPFGVLISRGGWAGSGLAIGIALNNYTLHKAFPELIDPEIVYSGLNYIYGTHPGSNISFVSAVGTKSKEVAYGGNRADFSFIAGGVVPGVLILNPDFPENKEDWPFLWGENEYVISVASSYIYLVNAVNDLLNEKNK